MEQWDNVRIVSKLVEKTEISSGILYRLSKYSEMYRSYILFDIVEGLMCVPYFHYDQSRNYRGIENAFWTRYVKPMLEFNDSKEQINRNLYFAECVIDAAMKLTRQGADKNEQYKSKQRKWL